MCFDDNGNFSFCSVRGLSLDFVFLNWTGFAVYGMFNIGLYAVPFIRVNPPKLPKIVHKYRWCF